MIRPTPFRPAPSPSSPMEFVEEINPRELEIGEAIGRGSYGTVTKGKWRRRNVAVKIFHTDAERESFEVEVQQLSCIRHPNIVALYGACTRNIPAYLVMEYAGGGSLNHLLHESEERYDMNNALSWALQTARGVAYLHNLKPKPIIHRDLKPANLLLFAGGNKLKICDFGTACPVRTLMTNNTGSASYMAPEVFKTSNYHEKCDVFSWAIILWEVLARRMPFSDLDSSPYQIIWAITEGKRPQLLEDCPMKIENLMLRSWDKEPLGRPSMKDVVKEMEYIYVLSGNDPQALLRSQSRGISAGLDGVNDSDSIDYLIINAHKVLEEPECKPLTLIYTDPESVELYRQHRDIAIEFLRLKLEDELIQRHNTQLLELTPNDSLQEFERFKQLAKDSNELRLFKSNMIEQINRFRTNETREINGWTLI